MGKPIKCVVRLHGMRREIMSGPYQSISEARSQLVHWRRPYTIVREGEKGYQSCIDYLEGEK